VKAYGHGPDKDTLSDERQIAESVAYLAQSSKAIVSLQRSKEGISRLRELLGLLECEERELAKDVEMEDGDAKAKLKEEWKAKRAEVKQARSNLAKVLAVPLEAETSVATAAAPPAAAVVPARTALPAQAAVQASTYRSASQPQPYSQPATTCT
jgi:hypothetical protein